MPALLFEAPPPGTVPPARRRGCLGATAGFAGAPEAPRRCGSSRVSGARTRGGFSPYEARSGARPARARPQAPRVRRAYGMQPARIAPATCDVSTRSEGAAWSASVPPRVDVRAYACPMTYVKTRRSRSSGSPRGERSRSARGRAARERAAERRRGRPPRGRGGAAGEPGAFRVLVEKGAEARRSGRSSGWWRRPDVNEDRIERYAAACAGLRRGGAGSAGRARVRAVGADAAAFAGARVASCRPASAGSGSRTPRTSHRRRERLAVRAVVGRYAARRRGAGGTSPPLSRFVSVERYPTGGVPTATLVFASSVPQALASAESARARGIPRRPRASTAAPVVVPPGAPPCWPALGPPPDRAPCTARHRSALRAGGAGARAHDREPRSIPGRRIDLVRGVVTTCPTMRLAGCACGGTADAGEVDAAEDRRAHGARAALAALAFSLGLPGGRACRPFSDRESSGRRGERRGLTMRERPQWDDVCATTRRANGNPLASRNNVWRDAIRQGILRELRARNGSARDARAMAGLGNAEEHGHADHRLRHLADGMNRAGKSTLAAHLAKRLAAAGRSVELLDEDGDARMLLKGLMPARRTSRPSRGSASSPRRSRAPEGRARRSRTATRGRRSARRASSRCSGGLLDGEAAAARSTGHLPASARR